MTISDSQKIDYLFKKIGYGATKTDTNSQKLAPNEAIPSPLLIRGDRVWKQAASIPGVKPGSSSGVVTCYVGASALETTADNTATANRTWKTGSTNWVPPGFGATYQLKVFAGPSGETDSETSGTQLFETGSGNDDQWYFDYQSGVLNFIGNNIPTAIGTGTANVIYVSGARYIGATGIGEADGASQTFRKATLSAVYSDNTIKNGDLIEVTDAGDGEYAVYIAKQDNPTATGHLTLVSSKDSAGSDAATLSANVTYNGGNVTLGDVSATTRPLSVIVDVTTAFDGSSVITIGDEDDTDRLMGTSYIDLSATGVYETNPSYVYADALDANNTIKVFVTAGTSSQGAATVLVSYS